MWRVLCHEWGQVQQSAAFSCLALTLSLPCRNTTSTLCCDNWGQYCAALLSNITHGTDTFSGVCQFSCGLKILKFLKLKAKTFLQRIRTLKNAHCLSCCHLQTHSTMIARERQKINWWCDQLGRTWSPLNRDLLHFSGQKRIRKRTNASRSRNTSETLASWEEMIEGRIFWNKPLKP